MHVHSHGSHQNTVLIVESPTLASIIDGFNIPYLTVIPTHGFCWIPHYDYSNKRITLRADPEKRNIRNRIRDQARWATRVIIATDYDAAGDTIAYSIATHLKRYDLTLLRAPLQGLSVDSVKKTMAQAKQLNRNSLTKRLRNRYQLKNRLKKWKNYLETDYFHVVLGLLSLLVNSHPHDKFIDSEGRLFLSEEPVQLSWNNHLEVFPGNKTQVRYNDTKPLSTADALQLFKDQLCYDNYQHIQYDLNRLFTQVPDAIHTGLISYPRTASRAFYRTTWEKIKKDWIKSRDLESFRPSAIQPTIAEEEPHEAIHPLQLTLSPSDIRPLIKKKYYDLYRYIYKYQKRVLRIPNVYESPLYFDKSKKITFYSNTSMKESNGSFYLHPYMKLGDLMFRLVSFKAIRPSSVGTCMDYLLQNSFIEIDEQSNVAAGPSLNRLKSKISRPGALKQFITYIEQELDGSFNPDMISTYLVNIFENSNGGI